MLNYEIENKKEIDDFMNFARQAGHNISSVKGAAPDGAMYSDGELISRVVNVAWKNDFTGESININYKKV